MSSKATDVEVRQLEKNETSAWDAFGLQRSKVRDVREDWGQVTWLGWYEKVTVGDRALQADIDDGFAAKAQLRSAKKTKMPSNKSAKNCLRFRGFRVKAKYRIAELRSDSISCLALAVPTPLPHTTSAFLRLSWWSLRARGRCTKDFGVPTHDQCRFPLTHVHYANAVTYFAYLANILHNFSAFVIAGRWWR